MPIKTLYDKKYRLIQTTCSGRISHSDLSNYQKTVWNDPDITDFHELIDFSDANLTEVCFSDLITLAQSASQVFSITSHSKLALITKTDQQRRLIDFYISARSLAETPTRPIKNFNSLTDALSWIS